MVERQLRVVSPRINLRDKPTTQSGIVTKLEFGSAVTVVGLGKTCVTMDGLSHHWVEIRTNLGAQPGDSGFLFGGSSLRPGSKLTSI